ncbi:MAG TPA: PAS domain S-box protein [Syntrophales bacterium]|nr:PAS domain S-box protein [Syntrophobacterales bacterium]HQL90443.1 PAS domain S-box protein [Syntrophales bacterium]
MVKDRGKDEPNQEPAALKKRIAELEQTLQNERETFGTIIQKSPYGVLLLDEKGKFLYINPEFVRVTGYALEDVPTGKVWFRKAFPDAEYRKKVIETWKSDMAANVRGSARVFHVTCRDGGTKVLEFRAARIDERRAMVMLTDITDRKRIEYALIESEERFRILSDHSPVGIALSRPDGVFEYLNPRFTEIFGYTIEDLPDNETFLKRVFPNPSYRDLVRYFHREDMENFIRHRKVGERVVTIRVRGGSDRIMHTRMVILGNGKQLMTYEDITDLKKMEAELFHAQNMEAVATLAGGIAHAFNNILMGIQGYTALMLSETKADHPAYGRLKRIEKQVRSGSDLTNQLLAFSSGGRYEVKPCNLNDIIEKTSNAFGLTRKDITIRKSLESGLWAVEIDQAQIEQVLVNLYVNAQQAMPGGGELTLKTRNVTLDEAYVRNYKVKPGNYVMVSVTDTGMGIDERTKERIFEPFFTTREMGRGRGLGLASAYGIIRGHQGIINIYSEEGEGTTFNLFLPATDKAAVKETVPPKGLLEGSETILFVDDEDVIIDVNREILESLGYKVVAAKSGQEAIEIYRKLRGKIGLVILDMIMPGMDGEATYDSLRKINDDVRVILSSGYSKNEQAKAILEKGCQAFIQKPFSISDLSMTIRQVLDKK